MSRYPVKNRRCLICQEPLRDRQEHFCSQRCINAFHNLKEKKIVLILTRKDARNVHRLIRLSRGEFMNAKELIRKGIFLVERYLLDKKRKEKEDVV